MMPFAITQMDPEMIDPEVPGARRDQGGFFIDQWTYQGMANPEEFRAASRGALSAPHPRDKERDT